MIESILNEAVKHSREILKAKAGNKYYYDINIPKQKGEHKEHLYENEMIDHKNNEFNKVREFADTLIRDNNYTKNNAFEINERIKKN
ncbi:hypothetical protein, partial [Xenorhabdus innexi]